MTAKLFYRALWIVTMLGLIYQLTGCGSTTPNLDAKFGDAVRAAQQQQTLDPSVPKGDDPVLGIDGQAAASTQGRYQESFKTPPQTFEVFGIGGSNGSTGTGQ